MKQLFILFLVLVYSYSGMSQDIPPVTNKILIKNVSITTQPGATPYIGHILVEDGIIKDVGTSIQAPYDAKVITGDSLHVYAGFIATLSHTGLKAPKENNERPRVDRTGYPPNDVAGITPELSINNIYDQKDGSIGDMRKQGFTIAHSVPHGRMLPGMGSIISLNGGSFNESVIVEDGSMFAQWRTANRVFPGTLIGIMSKWRELYRNSELTLQHNKNYKSNPRNRKRPAQDAATEALWPVVEKQMPVFFKAEKHRDIYRTLQLQKDLGFDLVIAEAKDIDRVLDDISGVSDVSVLLSLDLPKEEKEKSKSKDEKKEDMKGDKKMEEEDPKMAMLKKRKAEAVERYTSQAKMLSAKGMPVSFSYLETKPSDIHPSVRRLVKDGLSEKDALSALTTQAASAIGISDIAGTIERGKMGNLVIATQPIFDEKSKIKMVMIDGHIHEYEVKEKKKKSASDGEDIDPTGTWDYTIEIPGMSASGTMTITKNGEDYEAEMTSNQNPGEVAEAKEVELDGSDMSFSFSLPAGGMDLTIESDLTFDGDTFEGTVSVGDFGSFDITGSKSDPE